MEIEPSKLTDFLAKLSFKYVNLHIFLNFFFLTLINGAFLVESRLSIIMDLKTNDDY